MMTELERKRFLKVCGMMASPHDGEALEALRKANQMLNEAKLTWGEVILPRPVTVHDGYSQQAYDPPPEHRPEHRPGSPEMTWRLFSIRYPDVANWIVINRHHRRFAESLYQGVMTYGSLTEKQMAAVRRNL